VEDSSCGVEEFPVSQTSASHFDWSPGTKRERKKQLSKYVSTEKNSLQEQLFDISKLQVILLRDIS
jgi:hypothetical protein